MRILITGAGGFVGGHVAGLLAASGHEVIALAHRRWPAALAHRNRVKLERADLTSGKALAFGPFEALIHCAAAIPSAVPDEAQLTRVNAESTRRVFADALAAGARKIVYCSSMAVYGRIEADLVDPDTPIRSPGAYGRSKLEGERLLHELCQRAEGLSGLSIRLPGVVGAGSHDNFLSDTMSRLLAGQPVVARNAEALFNNVVHVADLAGFIDEVLGRLPEGHRVSTIAADEPLPVRRVVSILEAAAGRPGTARFEAGGKSFLISNESARRLGYRPPSVLASVTRFAKDVIAASRDNPRRPTSANS